MEEKNGRKALVALGYSLRGRHLYADVEEWVKNVTETQVNLISIRPEGAHKQVRVLGERGYEVGSYMTIPEMQACIKRIPEFAEEV